jgi:hypothetical protein
MRLAQTPYNNRKLLIVAGIADPRPGAITVTDLPRSATRGYSGENL